MLLLWTVLMLPLSLPAAEGAQGGSVPAGCEETWPDDLWLTLPEGTSRYEPMEAPPTTRELAEAVVEHHDIAKDQAGSGLFVASMNVVQEVSEIDDLRQRFTMPIFSEKHW